VNIISKTTYGMVLLGIVPGFQKSISDGVSGGLICTEIVKIESGSG